jgi:hypothetical protein
MAATEKAGVETPAFSHSIVRIFAYLINVTLLARVEPPLLTMTK